MGISDELQLAIGLCRRSSNDLLWNLLLDACLAQQQRVNNEIKQASVRLAYGSGIRKLMKQSVNDIVGKTLSTMMNEKDINLVHMFEKLVDKESSEQYEYYRDTIDVMLSSYKYETQMLKTANNLFRSGFHVLYKHHVEVAGAAYVTKENNKKEKVCKICDCSISDVNPKRLRLFCCGHLFHEHCLRKLKENLCPICYSNTGIKLNNKKAKEERRETNSVHGLQMMNAYAKKMNRLNLKMNQRDKVMQKSRSTENVSLSLAPANKAMMPSSTKSINMHIPAANWQLQFENRRKKACVIEID